MPQSAESVGVSLKNAIEGQDFDSLMSLYDDNAELRIVDQRNPPSSPLELHGKQAIANYHREIFARHLSHHVEKEIASDGQLAYTELCEYPDGSKVYTQSSLEIRDGKIVREFDVQAWDE